MKSVGIITFHDYNNYGTMLQALALEKAIKDLGYESEIIDFKQEKVYTFSQLLRLRIKRLPIYIKERKRYKAIQEFKKKAYAKNRLFSEFYCKYLHVGDIRYTSSISLMECPPSYDGYVVGSDQTWNPYAAGRPEAFYLPFVSNNKKKGSYAPSVAVSTLSEEQKDFIKCKLSDFAYLSCREKTGAKVLESILNREVKNVVDPTMLIESSDWQEYENPKICPNKKYLLMYFLGENEQQRQKARELAKDLNLDVVVIPATYLDSNAKESNFEVGPSEFLSLIKNATIICTDSFHGTIFSIIYRKDFYSFCKMKETDIKSENSRLFDTLDSFGLTDRIISDIPQMISHIDYNEIENSICNEIGSSREYLKCMLEDITSN